jgi:hypothetical protein
LTAALSACGASPAICRGGGWRPGRHSPPTTPFSARRAEAQGLLKSYRLHRGRIRFALSLGLFAQSIKKNTTPTLSASEAARDPLTLAFGREIWYRNKWSLYGLAIAITILIARSRGCWCNSSRGLEVILLVRRDYEAFLN